MKNNRRLLIVMTYIMILITIIAWAGGVYALNTDLLPIGMVESVVSNPIQAGVTLLLLGGLLTTTDVGLILYITRNRCRMVANVGSLMSWICGMASFALGTVDGRSEWMVYLLMTIPSLITWLFTGPSLKKSGESW